MPLIYGPYPSLADSGSVAYWSARMARRYPANTRIAGKAISTKVPAFGELLM
jgi:hypothetical protein